MAIERQPATPVEGTIEQDPQDQELTIAIENPDSLAIETEDGGMIIDFDPNAKEMGNIEFDSNLAEFIDDDVLQELGSKLVGDYNGDKDSRSEWEETYTKGLDQLGLKIEERTTPWSGACGVFHPMLSEAVIRFQSQSITEMFPAAGPVRTKIVGKITEEKEKQSQRVEDYLNYLLTHEMSEYRTETEKMLFSLPLAGSAFRKVYFDPSLDRPSSIFVPAEDVVVNYGASDLETCERATHVMRKSSNIVRKMQVNGFYRDIKIPDGSQKMSDITKKYDEITGESDTYNYDQSHTILEMQVDLDLEGFEDTDSSGKQTGIAIPYVVTIDFPSGIILSIRRNYYEDDSAKLRRMHFVHYQYLPGLGFYGFGLIHMVGGLAKSATSILRQLVDAGTLSNLPAGFKARGIRIRDEASPLQPGEFRDVDAPGGAIRDSLMPLPFKGPDQTLFNLLGFVVQAGQRFATITDMRVGDGNENAAVGTTMAMMEQGSRVMSAVHKRLHYAMRKEFKILSRVMSESLPQQYPYSVAGADETVMSTDFDGRVDIVPVSNPNVFSQSQRIVLAQTKLQLATQAPELHNLPEVFRDMYEALGITDVDRIMKQVPPNQPSPVDPAQENIDVLDMIPLHAFEGQNHMAHITAHLIFGMSPMISGNPAHAASLQKHVMEHVQIEAKEKAAVAYLQQVQQKGGQSASEGDMLEVESLAAQYMAEGLQQVQQLNQQLSGAGQPDPLVQLKEKELQIREQDNQASQQLDQTKVQLDAQKAQSRNEQFDRRLESQEATSQARIDSSMQREILKQQAKAASTKGEGS